MKIITPGNPKEHWIYDVTITCERCNARYQVENDEEFDEWHSISSVKTRCPHCGCRNETFKPRDPEWKRR